MPIRMIVIDEGNKILFGCERATEMIVRLV